jgi:DNA-binding transcriptional LysR family regulator
VAVAELAEHSLVMFREGYDLRVATLQACARAGVSPRLLSEGGDMDCVLALVRAGLGAAVVPRLVLGDHPGLRAVPFAAPGLWRRVGLAYRRDRPLSRAAQALQSIVAELAGYEGAGALA